MVYSVQKLCHYLLANHFVFYVDHQALLYLIDWPAMSGKIVRWMLLLQRYDFEVVYCPGNKYVMANHLSRLESGEPAFDTHLGTHSTQRILEIAICGVLTLWKITLAGNNQRRTK